MAIRSQVSDGSHRTCLCLLFNFFFIYFFFSFLASFSLFVPLVVAHASADAHHLPPLPRLLRPPTPTPLHPSTHPSNTKRHQYRSSDAMAVWFVGGAVLRGLAREERALLCPPMRRGCQQGACHWIANKASPSCEASLGCQGVTKPRMPMALASSASTPGGCWIKPTHLCLSQAREMGDAFLISLSRCSLACGLWQQSGSPPTPRPSPACLHLISEALAQVRLKGR